MQEAEGFLTAVTRYAYPVERLDAVPTDKDDNRVLECAVAADSEVIVSGDSDLLRLGNFRGIDITKASDLIGRLEGRT